MGILAPIVVIVIMAISGLSKAETYTIAGKEKQTKIQAIVALANNPKTKVEICKYKEKQDSNEGAVVCKPAELGPRGTIRLLK